MDTIKHMIHEREACFAEAEVLKERLKVAKAEGHDMKSAIIMSLMKGLSNNRNYGGRVINVSKDQMVKLAYEMYEVVKDFLEGIIHMNWQGPNSKLAIIGGLMINCDGDGTDMFLPLMFELRS